LKETGNGEGNIRTSDEPNAKVETPLKCRLATCSYKAFEPSMGHAVRITRFPPRWKLPYELAGSVMQLAPSWAEWQIGKSGDSHGFVAAYQARLSELGVATISAVLGSRFPHDRICLLCYERVDGVPPEERPFVCHRAAFAQFWTRETGDEVPELSDPCQPWRPSPYASPGSD
jgi:hypothetical protein